MFTIRLEKEMEVWPTEFFSANGICVWAPKELKEARTLEYTRRCTSIAYEHQKQQLAKLAWIHTLLTF